MSYEDDTGTVHSSAVSEVEEVKYYPKQKRILIQFGIYHDQAAMDAGKSPVGRSSFDLHPTEPDGDGDPVENVDYTALLTTMDAAKDAANTRLASSI